MISFTGRETMLTAGLKESKKATKTIEELAGYFNDFAPHGSAEEVAKEVAKASAAKNIESFMASRQPINLATDSSKSGANIEFFG